MYSMYIQHFQNILFTFSSPSLPRITASKLQKYSSSSFVLSPGLPAGKKTRPMMLFLIMDRVRLILFYSIACSNFIPLPLSSGSPAAPGDPGPIPFIPSILALLIPL